MVAFHALDAGDIGEEVHGVGEKDKHTAKREGCRNKKENVGVPEVFPVEGEHDGANDGHD